MLPLEQWNTPGTIQPSIPQGHGVGHGVGQGVVRKENSPEDPRRQTLSPYVTGTTVLGIKYADGVVLAADTLASYGSLARYKDVRRIRSLGAYTAIGATGEYSDFQRIMETMTSVVDGSDAYEDGYEMQPHELYSYVKRMMYQRRSKMDPLWNQLVLAGWRDGKALLGQVDSLGTSFEDDTAATGYGGYIARPLLRKAWRPDLNEADARRIIIDAMRVMYYRDARATKRIQICVINSSGVHIEHPHNLSTSWTLGESALGYPIPSN